MQPERRDVDTSNDEAVARLLQQQEGSIAYHHTITPPDPLPRPTTAPAPSSAAARDPTHANMGSSDRLLAQRLQDEEMRNRRAVHPSPAHRPDDSDMLYVPAKLAGRPVDLFVDTGAQSSVISEGIVKELGLYTRMNRMVWGTVHGVGTASVVGQLDRIPVEVGSSGVEFAMSFLVLNTQQPLLILGLDQMRKFKVLVDLDRQELTFGGHGGIPVPFIPSTSGSPPRFARSCSGRVRDHVNRLLTQ